MDYLMVSSFSLDNLDAFGGCLGARAATPDRTWTIENTYRRENTTTNEQFGGKIITIHEMISKVYNEDQILKFLLHILDCENQSLNL